MGTRTVGEWARRVRSELEGNILPFWMRHSVDWARGGFHGAVTNDLRVLDDVERSAVLCARILWTYSTAYRVLAKDEHLRVARHAFEELSRKFWDPRYGGVYWAVDSSGAPVNDRKHVYAQAFAMYGLAEYHRATREPRSLDLARELYGLVERHTHDNVHGGYSECRSREWGRLEDMRLSEKDLNSEKSMNTMLHLMEAHTNLMRVWDEAALAASQAGLVLAFLDRIVDGDTGHLKLFFDSEWRSLSETRSFGHDIEASWLLVEAAQEHGRADLLARATAVAVRMAQAVYDHGRDADGSILYEMTPHEVDGAKHWWVQAEGVVGFHNAWRLSSQEHFLVAAERLWDYIEERFVDRTHGDWHRVLSREGVPDVGHFKVGPWACPYHHSRVCFEMLERLGGRAEGP